MRQLLDHNGLQHETRRRCDEAGFHSRGAAEISAQV